MNTPRASGALGSAPRSLPGTVGRKQLVVGRGRHWSGRWLGVGGEALACPLWRGCGRGLVGRGGIGSRVSGGFGGEALACPLWLGCGRGLVGRGGIGSRVSGGVGGEALACPLWLGFGGEGLFGRRT